MIVLDSSAMLALLHAEAGGDLIQDLLDDADVPIYAHAINMAEVFYDALAATDANNARRIIQDLTQAGVMVRSDLDTAFWQDVATIIATQRGSGHRLALGDACGVALARREGADFYTTDRGELSPVAAAGLCNVIFIR